MCLSWLLEPSLSIKRKQKHILLFVLICLICRVICWYCNTKNMCAVVYIIRPSVFISFYFCFFPLGDLFYCTWLAGFTFLWLLFGNKTLCKKSSCIILVMLWLITKFSSSIWSSFHHFCVIAVHMQVILQIESNSIHLICSEESLNFYFIIFILGTLIASVIWRTLTPHVSQSTGKGGFKRWFS